MSAHCNPSPGKVQDNMPQYCLYLKHADQAFNNLRSFKCHLTEAILHCRLQDVFSRNHESYTSLADTKYTTMSHAQIKQITNTTIGPHSEVYNAVPTEPRADALLSLIPMLKLARLLQQRLVVSMCCMGLCKLLYAANDEVGHQADDHDCPWWGHM